MGKYWKEETVKVSELKSDAQTYRPFVDAMVHYFTHPEDPVERRSVAAHDLHIPPLSPAQARAFASTSRAAFEELRRTREEMMDELPVLIRADGSLWAHDHAYIVAMYHRFAPSANVRVVIIGDDPAAPEDETNQR